jgi:Ferritin-like domain
MTPARDPDASCVPSRPKRLRRCTELTDFDGFQACISDINILNFALNLEYLEASFYSWAVFGKGLDNETLGGGPPAIGGQKALLSPDAYVRSRI